MTGSLASAFLTFVRNAHRLMALGAVLAVGCNGYFPGLNSGQDNPTQFSETEECATTYSDAKYNYGFDLPADAEVVRTKNDSNALTNSLWTFTDSGALINVITRVDATSQDAVLGTMVSFGNDLSVSAGADLLLEEQVTLSNGDEGMHTIVRYDGLTTFRVQALSDAREYLVEVVVEESARTADLDTLLSEIVLSLCVGE